MRSSTFFASAPRTLRASVGVTHALFLLLTHLGPPPCSNDPRSDGENHYATFVEAAGGLEHIDQLQQHPNERIYELAYTIVTNYFQEEECGRRVVYVASLPFHSFNR